MLLVETDRQTETQTDRDRQTDEQTDICRHTDTRRPTDKKLDIRQDFNVRSTQGHVGTKIRHKQTDGQTDGRRETEGQRVTDCAAKELGPSSHACGQPGAAWGLSQGVRHSHYFTCALPCTVRWSPCNMRSQDRPV